MIFEYDFNMVFDKLREPGPLDKCGTHGIIRTNRQTPRMKPIENILATFRAKQV